MKSISDNGPRISLTSVIEYKRPTNHSLLRDLLIVLLRNFYTFCLPRGVFRMNKNVDDVTGIFSNQSHTQMLVKICGGECFRRKKTHMK